MDNVSSAFLNLKSGLQFDRNKHGKDMERFQVDSVDASKRTSTKHQNAVLKPAPTLDFFSTASKISVQQAEKPKKQRKFPVKVHKNESKESKTSELPLNKRPNEVVEVDNNENKSKKMKKVKNAEKIVAEDSSLDDSDVTLFSQPASEEESDDVEALSIEEQHKAEMGALRKANRIHVHGTDIVDPIISFDDLQSEYGVHEAYLRNMRKIGYEDPTAIQMQAIPLMLKEREVLAAAPTGSGKTMAFLLPVFHHLKEPKRDGFRAVIISPTRELAKQIYNECEKLGQGRRFHVQLLSKATASANNIGPKSNHKYDILISTPMRLVYMLKEDSIDLNNVRWLIMDEADKLWEMGFVEQMDEIIASCSHPKLVKALFSATLPPNVEEMARSTLTNPVNVTIGEKNAATETIKQKLVFVGKEDGKLLAIRQIIQAGVQPPVLIFVQSVDRAKELFNELIYDGINVDVIHSERTQAQRELVIKKFRLGETWVLIATDLLGRGIDFKGVSLVINYDFPQSPSDYIHRIGRTGRAGRQGEAITFFTNLDRVNLRSIANVMKESGCEVPDWMMEIPKPNKNILRQLRKKPISRKQISTASKSERIKMHNAGKRREFPKSSTDAETKTE